MKKVCRSQECRFPECRGATVTLLICSTLLLVKSPRMPLRFFTRPPVMVPWGQCYKTFFLRHRRRGQNKLDRLTQLSFWLAPKG